jgi:hypothetical protein
MSVQASISKMIPFGDCPFVVEMIVMSSRDTFLSDGVLLESTEAGFLMSSFGLVDDSIGLALIFLPSGAKKVTSNRSTLALGVLSRGIVTDWTSAGVPKLTVMVGRFCSSGNETPLFELGWNSSFSFCGTSTGVTMIFLLVSSSTACISSHRLVVMIVLVVGVITAVDVCWGVPETVDVGVRREVAVGTVSDVVPGDI